jgi:hypothetical protein
MIYSGTIITPGAQQYIKGLALKKLIYFKWGATEIALDRYLKQQFKLSLGMACRLIIINSKISVGKLNTYTVSTIHPYWEKLSRIITFGTGQIKGSQILKFIFNLKGV